MATQNQCEISEVSKVVESGFGQADPNFTFGQDIVDFTVK